MKKYKLIKEYPNSVKLGTVVITNEYDYLMFNPGTCNFVGIYPSKHPEYWQEVKEAEYEILSFIDMNNGNIFDDIKWSVYFKDKMYYSKVTDTWVNEKHGKNYVIHSVKRISDGQIFTIGDRVKYYNRYTAINKIYYNEHSQLSFKVEGTEAPLTGVFMENNLHFKKINKPIFITEDGVELYQGDEINSVHKETLVLNCNTNESGIVGDNFISNDKYLYFSTKKAAEKYILLNKHRFSIQEISDLLKEWMYKGHRSNLIMPGFQEYLENVVKNKLK